MPEGKARFKDFFPHEEFRPYQLDAIEFIYGVIKRGRVGLLSSPCGTGKSVSALTAYLTARSEGDVGRLVILVRTRSQLNIYAREMREIARLGLARFSAAMFTSKQETCPVAAENKSLREARYSDFLRICKGLKSGRFGERCTYYASTISRGRPTWPAVRFARRAAKEAMLPDEVAELCMLEGFCPHEVTRLMAREADIIVGNYNYVLIKEVRGSVLGRAGIVPYRANVVFDEAHSLPMYCTSLLSDDLSTRSVRRAVREAKMYGVDDAGLLMALGKVMVRLGAEAEERCGLDSEVLVDPGEVADALSEAASERGLDLEEALEQLLDEGERVRVERLEAGKPPSSYVARVAEFLGSFLTASGPKYAHYAKAEGDGETVYRLGVACLDASEAAGVINEFRSALLMSGTLWDPDYYAGVLGLDRPRVEYKELPDPFPPENRAIIIDRSVTTKYERRPEMLGRIAERLSAVIEAVQGRVAAFFPSYEVLSAVAGKLSVSVPVLAEGRRTKFSEVVEFLRSNARCAVLAVARGKVSEGVDLTEEGASLLDAVVIVGLPYPKRTELHQALVKYYEGKFGDRAFDYAAVNPCAVALAQAAGRLIRGPEDRGAVIIMDSRALGKFRSKLPKSWLSSLRAHYKIERLVEDVSQACSKRASRT